MDGHSPKAVIPLHGRVDNPYFTVDNAARLQEAQDTWLEMLTTNPVVRWALPGTLDHVAIANMLSLDHPRPVAQLLKEGARCILCCHPTDAQSILGCAFFEPPPELLPEVVRQAETEVFSIVAVQPELRGRGVGMLLALKTEDEAAERELAQFTICIAPPSDSKLLLRAMKLRGFERPTGRAAGSPDWLLSKVLDESVLPQPRDGVARATLAADAANEMIAAAKALQQSFYGNSAAE